MIRELTRFLLKALAMAPLFSTLGDAQPLPAMTHHVREVTLTGQAKSLGRLPSDQVMALDLVLPLNDQEGLAAFLKDLYNPASPNFHRYLTVSEFTNRFGPSQQNYDALVNFAQTNGLQVVGGSRDGMDLQVKGTVSAVENAFHITMSSYQHPTENRTFYAPDREPTLDLPFALWHISGLDNYSIPQPKLVNRNDYALAHGISPAAVVSHATTGSGPSASFLGSDMRAAYYGSGPLTGAGQNLGLWEYAGTDLADLTTYFANIGQTNNVPITLLSVDGTSTSCVDSGKTKCSDIEQTLDMTQAIGMAPGLASLVVYIGSSDTAIASAMTTHNPLPLTIGCSWGWTPADPTTLNPYFQKMAAQGQTFLTASGDSSTWSSSNSAWPADAAYVVAVGGTDLITTGAGGAWLSETAWADSGGGISPDGVAIPSWQQLSGVINSNNGGSTTLRNGPDVSANANFTFYVCGNQTTCTANNYGGTSFAAPMWAGLLALANQQAAASGSKPVGFINLTIYPQNTTSAYATNFHDITSGVSGSYSAVPGYDLVTGWGSPNGAALIGNLLGTLLSQTITFGSISTQTVGVPLTLTATASSGLTVSYSSSTTSVCTVSGSTATFLAAGSCSITASQAGNSTYAAATPVTQSFSVTGATSSSSASYVGADTTTQGTWTGVYGADGDIIFNDSTAPPSYATVSFTGGATYTWASSTTDVRALQTASGASSRIASTYYSEGNFNINLDLTDGNTHRIALYLCDWDNAGRAETITIKDAASGAVLDTENYAKFSNGVWAIWNLKGNVVIQVTLTGGANSIVNGIFFGGGSGTLLSQTITFGSIATQTVGVPLTLTATASSGLLVSYTSSTASVCTVSGSTATFLAAGSCSITASQTGNSTYAAATPVTQNFSVTGTPASSSASYVGADTTTQGTWTGVYGADGDIIFNDSNAPPSYATVSFTGGATYTWASSTTDVRALQTASGASSRIASTYYSEGNFNINLDLTDGNTHRVALYLCDWDNAGRAETITIKDAVSGAVLDTENYTNFVNGVWAIWNLKGNVVIQVTLIGGANSIVNGIFFGGGSGTLLNQTITFGSIATQTVGVPLTLTATASSGLTVSYTSSTTSVCTVSGSIATFLAAGTCSITASQTGNSTYAAATPVTQNFSVTGTPASSSASYLGADTTTQGTWTGVYGADGDIIFNDSNAPPSYATVSFAGGATYTWASSTTDIRALQTASGASTRIASTYYSEGNFNINLDLTDGNTHRVALYLCDWDNAGRAETITIKDAASGAVLDTENYANFVNGVWAVWNLKGNVVIQVTLTGGANSILNGVFFK